MLPLKSILMHRLNHFAKIIDDQIRDHLDGIEPDEEDECTPQSTVLPSRIYYTELCNQWLVNLSKGLDSSTLFFLTFDPTPDVARDRLTLNGENTPIPLISVPRFENPKIHSFPPEDAPWWQDVQKVLRPNVTVLRDSVLKSIDARYIVIGDILYITGGCRIHADVRVLVADQSVAESYLGDEPRRYTVTESSSNYDPRLTSNLLPYGSVLLEGHLFGMVLRIGKRTLQQLIEKPISEDMLSNQINKATLSKLKKQFMNLCKSNVVPRTIRCVDEAPRVRYIIIALPTFNQSDLERSCLECTALGCRMLIINHDSLIDSSLSSLFPFRDDVPFTYEAVSSFTSEWIQRDSTVEGLLLSPDMCRSVMMAIRECLDRSLRGANHPLSIAFVGGTYVEHIDAVARADISFCFLSGVEMVRARCDGVLLSDGLTQFFNALKTIRTCESSHLFPCSIL